ncbi:MAG: hypothetical protein NZ824_12610 [Candidatus Thioglobus sp.]|nr:hypothetical protein [Candidatus Thioglobus sp.]
MNNSIEEIWKQGFISNDALVAPVINDLYNQKSQNIVDKFELVFKWNLIGLVAFALVVLVALILFGTPYLGLFISAMLMALVIRGRKEQASLKLLDKNVNSYQYLKSFDNWLKEMMLSYAKLYSFFYPALFLSMAVQSRFTELGQAAINGFVNEFPDTVMLFSTPLYLLLAVAVIASLLFYFSGSLYRIDFNSVYGRMLTKLEDLISDMEELRR